MSRRAGGSARPPARAEGGRAAAGDYLSVPPAVSFTPEATFVGRRRELPLGDRELAFIAACDGSTPLARIRADDRGVRGIHAQRLPYCVWWDRPAADCEVEPGSGEVTLLVSPHPDDVELAMGGWLIGQRGHGTLVHLVCFSHLTHARDPEAFPTEAEVTAVRCEESALSARLLGLANHWLGLPELPLRAAWSQENGDGRLEADVAQLLRVALCREVARYRPTRLFAPAAAGDHPDHRLVFDAVLELFEEGALGEAEVVLYEDFPYAAAQLAVDELLARFERSYLRLEPWYVEISSVLPLKRHLSRVFVSQLGPGATEAIGAVAARNAELARSCPTGAVRACAAERFWLLRERSFAQHLRL